MLSALLVLAGCGGGSRKPGDPGREAMDKLVSAAAQHDEDAVWELVTDATHGRLQTKARVFVLGESRLRPFVSGRYRTVVSQLIADQHGVVAIDNRRAVLAIAFRKVKGDLLAELGTALKAEPIGPLPKVYTNHVPQQIGVAVKGGAGDANAVLWLEGETVARWEVRPRLRRSASGGY